MWLYYARSDLRVQIIHMHVYEQVLDTLKSEAF